MDSKVPIGTPTIPSFVRWGRSTGGALAQDVLAA